MWDSTDYLEEMLWKNVLKCKNQYNQSVSISPAANISYEKNLLGTMHW